MKKFYFFSFVFVACLLAVKAHSSTFIAMSQADLVRQADAVVQGEVIGLQSSWTPSGRIIVTDATIAVDEVLVGNTSSTLTVRTFGGKVGDYTVEAHGFPTFQMGERVILFVYLDPDDGTLRVLGYQQGHFRVVTRLDGVTLAVPMVEDGARFFTPGGTLTPEPQSVEIGSFKSAVRAAARRVGRTDVQQGRGR